MQKGFTKACVLTQIQDFGIDRAHLLITAIFQQSLRGFGRHSPSGTYLPILYNTTMDINYVHMLYFS